MASSEYISREAAEKVFSQPVTMSMCLTLEECKMKNAQRQIDLFVIRGLPAADVRPVVTCGECKYWELSKIEPPFPVCTYVCGVTFVRSAGDFCSRGEKREES